MAQWCAACCLLQVPQQLPSAAPADGRLEAAAALLRRHPALLRRLGELQLEGRLRSKRRDRARAAVFSWLYGRQVVLA